MFDDLFGWLVVIALVGGIGWLLGIVAFFRAAQALREIASLRASLVPIRTTVPAARIDLAPTPDPPPDPSPPDPSPPDPSPPESSTPARKPRSLDIEELLTARWGVWLGAAALMLAGVFLVRYAVEEGWLGPAVRCAAMAALGLVLVACGLVLARRPAAALPFPDQTPAALAAGGVVILFGGAYAADVLYGLVPPPIGFVLMSAASIVGLTASLRLGPLVAAVGIVGAFVTPALVQTDNPSWPGLFAYLLFVAAASLGAVRYSAWVWLGWATTVAGAAWVVVASVAVPLDSAWAPALFVPALAALHLALLAGAALETRIGRRLAWVPVAALGAAGLLVVLINPAPETRAALLLLAPVTMAKAAYEDRLAPLPWVAAALFLAVVVTWDLPAWHPTGEPVTAGGHVLAVLPGDWTPEALRPFLLTTLGMAGLFAAAGLVGERRRSRALPWASLMAAVPVLALALAYGRVRQFQPDAAWAAISLLLAAGLTGIAALAARAGAAPRAGVHAAGATAALALGFAMLLTAQWLTIALALLLPALALIEAQAGLPGLRRVSLAVAAVVLVRLLANQDVLDYVNGEPPVLNGRALAYAIAAIAFAVASRMERRRADDRLVAVLEVGGAAFVTALVALEIRQWATAGEPRAAELSFTEAALQVAALAVLATATLWLDRRAGRSALRWSWGVQGSLALIGGAGLILFNPMLVAGLSVGTLPFLDALLPAYAVPALLAGAATRGSRLSTGLRRVLLVYALAAGFAWVTLEVRHIAHPGAMALDEAPVLDGELWAWSGAWMALAIALMAAGLVSHRRILRLAALAVMALVTAKVFLIDMAGLTGLWRVLSFLGLGLTLIGLGRLYGRFAARPASAQV